MIGLFTAAEVRAAEEPVLAATPEGALMQQAATGLAAVCIRLLGSVYGRRVVLLVGTGNNGGDALHAGAHLARRGALVTAVLLDPDRAHAAGLAALRTAGGRVLDPGDAAAAIGRADGPPAAKRAKCSRWRDRKRSGISCSSVIASASSSVYPKIACAPSLKRVMRCSASTEMIASAAMETIPENLASDRRSSSAARLRSVMSCTCEMK